jgi:outer membrane protein assembly factor BamB
MTAKAKAARPAEIVREYGPFPQNVNGLTFDGQNVWFAADDRIQSLDPKSGELGRSLPVRAPAGTAYDGKHFYQIADGKIHKVDPQTGEILKTIPAPSKQSSDSGLAWAEGSLWVGQAKDRAIVQIDPEDGRILRTIASPSIVTGVTFVDDELWHGTWEGDVSDLRRIDPQTGELLEQLTLPDGTGVSGIESDGADLLYCGGGRTRKVRAVRCPR